MNCLELMDMNNRLEPGQHKVLGLLKELDEICRKHGINYYASGGTALGAIRHNGFIPWDDDADVHMTRDDFHKLLQLPESAFPPNRKISCWETDEDYNHSSARYIDTTATVLYKHHATRDYDTGATLDIVVLEPMPADPAKWEKHMDLIQVWGEFRTPELVTLHRWWGKSYYRRYLLLDKLIGRKRLLKHLEKKIYCHPDDENTTAYHQRWVSVPWIFPKAYFKEPLRLPFEDMTVSVPTEVEDFLTQSYTDDWMMIPPPSYRDHHDSIEHTSLPSRVFTRDFRKHLSNKKQMFRVFRRRSNNLIDNREFRNEYTEGNLYFLTKQLEKDLQDKLSGRSISDILAEKDFNALGEILEMYLSVQYASACIGDRSYGAWYRRNNPILLDLPDEIHYAGLIYALHKGMLPKADRVLKAKALRCAELPAEFAELQKYVDALRGAVSLFFRKNYAEAKSICEEWTAKFPDFIDLIRLDIALEHEMLDGSEEKEKELLAKAEAALGTAPQDDVIRYIAVQMLKRPWNAEKGESIEATVTVGEEEQHFTAAEYAQYLTDSLYENCSNGFILMALRKELEAKALADPENEETYALLRTVLERTGVRFKNIDPTPTEQLLGKFAEVCSPETAAALEKVLKDKKMQVTELSSDEDMNLQLGNVLKLRFSEDPETAEELLRLLAEAGIEAEDFDFEEDPNKALCEALRRRDPALADRLQAALDAADLHIVKPAPRRDRSDLFLSVLTENFENAEELRDKLKKALADAGLRIGSYNVGGDLPEELFAANAEEADSIANAHTETNFSEEIQTEEFQTAGGMRDDGRTLSAERRQYTFRMNAQAAADGERTFCDVFLQLLREIDEICCANSIPYYITQAGAAAAAKHIDLPNTFSRARIAMYPEDFLRFRNAVTAAKLKNRRLDSMLDNGGFPHLGARYSDETTLHFPVVSHKYYASHGLAVEIDFIRRENKSFRGKIALGLESAWEFMHIRLHGYRVKPAVLAAGLRVLRAVVGKKALARGIFRACTKASLASRSEICFIRPFNGKEKVKQFHCSVFGWPQRRMLNGLEFSFPAELEEYLYTMSGSWRRQAVGGTGRDRNNIKDTNMSYHEYEAMLDPAAVSREWRRTKKLNRINAMNARYVKRISEYWHIMLRSEARIRLWELYGPRKELILSLAEKKEYDRLTVLLGEYMKEISRFAKWKMGLCFDKEIMDVMVEVMKHNGMHNAAKELLRTTPKSTYAQPDLSY